MNYYERHIGDYLKDTVHLSLLEHGIYGRLLDIYYTRESALPAEQVMRLVGARTDEERSAVRDVLNEFFTEEDGLFKHSRCDREIARYQEKQRKASVSASARWNKSAEHTERNANAMRTHSEGNALQTPDTRHQTPKEENPPTPRKRGERLSDSWEPGDEGRSFALTLGISGARFQSEAERFADYWSSQPGMKGVKTDWPATWRNWCRNAAERAPPGRTDRPPDRKSVQLQTAALMTGTHRNTVEIINDSETVIARRLG